MLDPAAKAVDETYQEWQEWLTACLEKLPEPQRDLLRQRYADGLLPPQLETVYCDSPSLHTAQRKIVAAPNGVRLEDGRLRYVDARQVFGEHGLLVTCWTEAVSGVPNCPNGINVDSIYPVEATLLAQDPRPISTEQDHTLRVEKRGPQQRVWVDQELRIDTQLSYPLAPDRKQTSAISSFGTGPQIRALRVWRVAGD